jgi:quercetin dioxygenase-like cupin family protein
MNCALSRIHLLLIRWLCASSDVTGSYEIEKLLHRFNMINLFTKENPMARQIVDLHVNPSDETIRLGPLSVRFLLTGDNSTGSIAAFELVVPGAQRLAAPGHSHDQYEETIYGIEGVLTWTVDGKQIVVGPGQALCIPRGAIHRFDNNGMQDVKALCVITPAAIGPQYFREAAEVINARPGGPPDPAKMAEIMRRHGLTPAPPQA